VSVDAQEEIMGTKNNPGDFDCYANAEPDEPMFVLLGRDPTAAALVRLWAATRAEQGEDPVKIAECVLAMRQYATARKGEAAIQASADAMASALRRMAAGSL
jgi:hypothetical protein